VRLGGAGGAGGDLMPEMELEADPGSLGERGALELMHGVLRALASAATIDDVLHVIVGHGAHVFHPVGAVVGRQTDGTVLDVARWGSSLDLADGPLERQRLARDPWNDAISLCEAIWVPSIEERKARYPDLRVSDDVETLVALPLVAHGRAFGVFGIAFAVPYRFEELPRAFLITLADLCALWLLNVERANADGVREAERIAAADLHAVGPSPLPRLPNGSPEVSNGSRTIDLRGSSARDVKLTAREQEITIALTQGLRSSAVARDLGISIFTVRKHISSILRKYDVTSQTELIARIYGQSTAPGADLEQSV
jgi:DNA-binding CsgD family transcriptional regulator